MIARINAQTMRLRNGTKIRKQKMARTAMSPARIRTSSNCLENTRSVIGVISMTCLPAGHLKELTSRYLLVLGVTDIATASVYTT